MVEKRLWAEEKAWADNHVNEINDVVRKVVGKIIEIRATDPERDMNEAIDYEILVPSGNMACRIRRADRYNYRDLTLTLERPSGAPAEVDKIRKGGVRWYLYAWAAEGRFIDWIFVDLSVVLVKGLIEAAETRKNIRHNADGSSFVFISAKELDAAGALVARSEDLRPIQSAS